MKITRPFSFLVLAVLAIGSISLLADERRESPPRGEQRERAEPPRRVPGPPRDGDNTGRERAPEPERDRTREPGRERDGDRRAEPARERHPEPVPHLEEMERRVHHLHVAAENLEQAGLHDEAHAFHERAEHLERELHEARERHHRPPHPPGPGEDLDRLNREVAELRELVHDLRAHVQELQKALDQRSAKPIAEDDYPFAR